MLGEKHVSDPEYFELNPINFMVGFAQVLTLDTEEIVTLWDIATLRKLKTLGKVDFDKQVRTGAANTMWRKLLYSGFETCFGPSTQHPGPSTQHPWCWDQNTSQIHILRHFEKRDSDEIVRD